MCLSRSMRDATKLPRDSSGCWFKFFFGVAIRTLKEVFGVGRYHARRLCASGEINHHGGCYCQYSSCYSKIAYILFWVIFCIQAQGLTWLSESCDDVQLLNFLGFLMMG